eukprot:CAMPEP_0176433804 /NCGR_PEP_ID=MMETSP0127-20121128/16261_1 /TAXON_ID=938130 /ORGANISM="Platyophrya macrostoma, Strain WH" /LENGTH=264 /DNA_ID=CAMNT_0017816343 /DNA_START=40 /DNA_END=834 /DNA_ORIENTATION=-
MGSDHHDDSHHDDHHGHGHGEMPRVPYTKQAPPFEKIPLPQLGSTEHLEQLQAFDNNRPIPQPRSMMDRFAKVLRLEVFLDKDMPAMSHPNSRGYASYLDWLTSSLVPLRPKDYVDAYTRPNPCPEEFWHIPWKWPRTKYVNAKVPPPVDGKYNDYYHYLAYKNWLQRERDVYVAHTNLVHDALCRCIVREGQYNAPKNCKHIANKSFAMSRMEELNQTLLYMALTGNCAIRETPYPAEFLEEKRKIYDDWLTRTRMKKPGDVA